MNKEEIIKSDIAFWIGTNPIYKEYFSKGFVGELIHVCEIIVQGYTIHHPLA
jgi:hypothetical protein